MHTVSEWREMNKIRKCNFESIADCFNFGRYDGCSLADVLDINPSYLSWCIKYCSRVIVQLKDSALEEIKIVYPNFLMDALFENKRRWHLSLHDCYDFEDDEYCYSEEDDCNDSDNDDYDRDWDEYESNFEEEPTFERYAGSWAQDVEGYSDDDIDTIFDGDPSAYWNID